MIDDDLALSGVREFRLQLRRLLVDRIRNPGVTVRNLAQAILLLLIYDGALGPTLGLLPFAGGDYVSYLIPVAILLSSFTGVTAGLAVVGDIESGYFRRQLTMPLSRAAMVAAPVTLAALQILIQATLIVLVGLALGATAAGGILAWPALLAFAVVWGLAFAGLSVATALRTGSAQAVVATSTLLLPLFMVTSTWVPTDLMKDWMQAAAKINPVTYVLDGMRTPLLEGWDLLVALRGAVVALVFSAVMIAGAIREARRATTRE
jgi:ABC-2 type transport system permease protein